MEDTDDFFERTTLRWVRWVKRKPDYSGAVYMRYNGKNAGVALVMFGDIVKLDNLDESTIKEYENTFYWLEEIFPNT